MKGVTIHESSAMKPADTPTAAIDHDVLTQYATAVAGLHTKLNRIRHNQHHVAASLGRAAQALRSIRPENSSLTLISLISPNAPLTGTTTMQHWTISRDAEDRVSEMRFHME